MAGVPTSSSLQSANEHYSLLHYLRELARSRELLYQWTRREFRVRYSQSYLGAAWAILQPLSLMLIFSLVFSLFIRVPTNDIPYPVLAYSALLPWTFFANALSFAIPSLVSNFNLVGKIYFPREILPLAAIIVSFIDFLIASIVFGLLLIYYHISLGSAVVLLPLLILIQITLTFGITLLASAFNVFYRDVRFLIPLVLQLWMYLSPIIYPTDIVPERFRAFYFLNPMATLIAAYQRIIFYNEMPDWPYVFLAGLVSILLLIVAFRYFKRSETRFADLI